MPRRNRRRFRHVAESDAHRAVRYTAFLEKSPLSPKAPEMRRWLLDWLTATPDYTINVCDGLFGKKSVVKGVPHGPELLVQQMYGNAAFQITHPGNHDEVEFQMAGMESLLRTYKVIIHGHPEWHIKYYDTLLKKQSKGELKSYLTPIIKKSCQKPGK